MGCSGSSGLSQSTAIGNNSNSSSGTTTHEEGHSGREGGTTVRDHHDGSSSSTKGTTLPAKKVRNTRRNSEEKMGSGRFLVSSSIFNGGSPPKVLSNPKDTSDDAPPGFEVDLPTNMTPKGRTRASLRVVGGGAGLVSLDPTPSHPTPPLNMPAFVDTLSPRGSLTDDPNVGESSAASGGGGPAPPSAANRNPLCSFSQGDSDSDQAHRGRESGVGGSGDFGMTVGSSAISRSDVNNISLGSVNPQFSVTTTSSLPASTTAMHHTNSQTGYLERSSLLPVPHIEKSCQNIHQTATSHQKQQQQQEEEQNTSYPTRSLSEPHLGASSTSNKSSHGGIDAAGSSTASEMGSSDLGSTTKSLNSFHGGIGGASPGQYLTVPGGTPGSMAHAGSSVASAAWLASNPLLLLSEPARTVQKKLHNASRFKLRAPNATFTQVYNSEHTLVLLQHEQPPQESNGGLISVSSEGSITPPRIKLKSTLTEVQFDAIAFPPTHTQRRAMQVTELAAGNTPRGGAMLWPAPRAMLTLLPQKQHNGGSPGSSFNNSFNNNSNNFFSRSPSPGAATNVSFNSPAKPTFALSQSGWQDGECTVDEAEEIRKRQYEARQLMKMSQTDSTIFPTAAASTGSSPLASYLDTGGGDADSDDEDEVEEVVEGGTSSSQGHYVLLPMFILGDASQVSGVSAAELRAERRAACRHIRDSLPTVNQALINGEYDELRRFAQRSHKATTRTGLRCLRSIFTQLQAVLMDLQCLYDDPIAFLEVVEHGGANTEFLAEVFSAQPQKVGAGKTSTQRGCSGGGDVFPDGLQEATRFPVSPQDATPEQLDYLSRRLIDDCRYCLLSAQSAVLGHVNLKTGRKKRNIK